MLHSAAGQGQKNDWWTLGVTLGVTLRFDPLWHVHAHRSEFSHLKWEETWLCFLFFFFFFVSSCPFSVGCSLKRLLPHFHELVCYDFMIIYDSLSACTRTCSCCPLITTALSHQLVSVIAQRWGSAWESGRAHTMGHTHTHIQSCGVLSHHSHRNLKYLTWCPAFVLEIASKKESGRTQV